MTQAFKNFILIVIIFIFASPEVFAQKESSINVTEVSTKKKYGKTQKTAIEVGTVGNEYDYLDQLCGQMEKESNTKESKAPKGLGIKLQN